MIDFLAGLSGKYRRVLAGEDMALISIIGTEDWEDYANLSFTAMQAEGIADIDARLEKLTEVVERIERQLGRVADSLEPNRASLPESE